MLRTLSELALLNQQGIALFMGFIDLEKAYNRVNRNFLFHKLHTYGYPPKLMCVLKSMYINPNLVVAWDDSVSNPFPMHMGLKQGIASPQLLSIYLADLYNWIMENRTISRGATLGIYWCH